MRQTGAENDIQQFVQAWDVMPGKMDSYEDFIMQEYNPAMMELKNNYATDYDSKILSPTGRVEVPHLIGERMKNF